MKYFTVVLVVALTCTSPLFAQSPSSQSSPTTTRARVKNDKSVVRDKSKLVRKALEDWYVRNVAAFKAKDVDAVMALRTDDFQTRTPDGKLNTRADMEAYTQRLLQAVDHFISLDFQIGTIDVQGDLASAEVTQKTVRMQRLADGDLHKVETGAVQRETFKKTAGGWKMFQVEDVRDNGVLIDDKPFKPGN